MKRIVAFLLTALMLFSLLPAGANADTAAFTEKPFIMLNMGGTDGETYSHIYNFPGTYTYKLYEDTTEPRVHAFGTEDYIEMAAKMKETFDAYPEGSRYFQLDLLHASFQQKAENVVYFDTAVAMTSKWLHAFLAEYKRIGGQLDGIVVDLEYIESHGYYLKDYYTGARNKTVNQNIYADIVNDPRYETRVRPMLVEMGFEFYPEPSGHKSEIWTIYSGDKESYRSISYNVWNHVMDYLERQAINEAVLEPLLQYYPDAMVSDYQSGTYVAWEKCLDSHGAIRTYNLTSAGNVANFNAYSGRPESSYFKNGKQTTNNPPSFNKAIYEASPFTATMYDVNLFKNIQASTTTGRIDAWIGNYEYGRYEDGTLVDNGYKDVYSGTPYYSEMIYHIGLLNPIALHGFIIGTKLNRDGFYMCDSLPITNDIMAELSRVAGFSDRKAIKTDANWNGDYILTGMYSGGRNIWRVTPDTSKVSVADFKVSDSDPTFKIGGVTITFPQGKIIEDTKIAVAGSCGYWVETPDGVKPVVTGSVDRYKNDPSFLENFEQYAADSAFTKSSAKPIDCWEVEGAPLIQAGDTGNALAMMNDSTVKLLTLPKNITAGDEYAKQQGWEITVTLPADFSGTIQVLKCTEDDCGVKLADGKVYYDQNGSLQELTGVTLTAGTYTIKREVDFRSSNFTCNYAVYDASGNLLGEAKDVAMKSFELPVVDMTMSSTGRDLVALLDDFKMYPMGTTTVLELYETKYGKELTDITATRTEDTAYRMSWMNASNDAKVAYIYDATNGKTIQIVEMGPGMDGIVTGVVKADGKELRIAVEVQSVNASGDGEENNGDATAPSGNQGVIPGWTGPTDSNQAGGSSMNPGLIVLIVCACIAVLGGGFALYWSSSKSKKKKKKRSAKKGK